MEALSSRIEKYESEVGAARGAYFGNGRRRSLRSLGLSLLDEADLLERLDLSERILMQLRPLGALPDFVLDRLGRLALTLPESPSNTAMLVRIALVHFDPGEPFKLTGNEVAELKARLNKVLSRDPHSAPLLNENPEVRRFLTM